MTLGEEMKVTFSIGKDLPIYVKSCKAKKSSSADNSVDFFLVESGCEKPKTGIIAQIDPQQQDGSCDSGTCKVELFFNQFGFVADGASAGKPYEVIITSSNQCFRLSKPDFQSGLQHCLWHCPKQLPYPKGSLR